MTHGATASTMDFVVVVCILLLTVSTQGVHILYLQTYFSRAISSLKLICSININLFQAFEAF